MKRLFTVFGILSLIFSACTQKKLSERDQKLQERQQAIDVKKNELGPLAGTYYGQLTGENSYNQNIKVVLEVKDVPQSDGQADPILIPKLVGNLRFLYGSEDSNEYIDCVIKSAEYNKSTHQISLVIVHQQFNEMLLSGIVSSNKISGSWNAASVGVRGDFQVDKGEK